MLKHVESESNVHHDSSPLSSDEQHTISSNVEYFNAVENGYVPVIPISNAAFISSMRNSSGETLLIAAARCGHAHVVESLLNDIDVEETDYDGWNALLNAAHQGHAAVVRVLLDVGKASIDQPDYMGWTPLMWACYKDRYEVVDELLKRKAHVNVVGEEDSLTPLIIASGRGYTDVVRRLLEAGAHINSSDKFGSTALIWAARKGHLEIVELLLSGGAQLDSVGMHASTALMLATRGNHVKVVNALLRHEPNVNVVDYNGLSALGMAAREGYTEIAQALIQSGAYVNTIDRFGNSILASAVRSGNIHLVRILLERHADVNAKDSESRTPLHLAIDKAYVDIVLALLEKRPNLELRNKDGETALLRAVKNRDVTLCQLLVSAGAKLSATDNAGDNALHLALRARSRRLTQTLLVNPSDSKLLYRPNRLGETPYSIDQEAADGRPILPSIFGPIGSTDINLKNLLGYDAYGDVLADVVCEPSLSLPLTIGLYAKWGSGKSLLLPKIRDSMKSFSRSWLDGMELYWSWTLVVLIFVFCAFLTLLFTAAIATFTPTNSAIPTSASPINWGITIGFAASLCVALLSGYGFVYYGSEIRLWNGSIATARAIARAIARFKVLLSVFTLNAPMRTDKELVVSPVSFLFADDHRLSFIGGEQALVNIIQSLFISAEEHYGALAVRLFCAFNTAAAAPPAVATVDGRGGGLGTRYSSVHHSSTKLRSLCGIPMILYLVVMIISLTASLCLFIKHIQLTTSEYMPIVNGVATVGADAPNHSDAASYAIAALVFLIIFGVTALAPLHLLCVRMFTNLPRRRMNRISHKLHLLPFERTVQKLQREVDLLVAMIATLDAFTNSQTRMVVMVDGLDSCEQNKMVQIFDALTLFFASRQNAPFIVLLAIDPHIVINAIQQNLLRGGSAAVAPAANSGGAAVSMAYGSGNAEITGYDYMRNVVSMPFFLDHNALKQLQSNDSRPAIRRFQQLRRRRANSSSFKVQNTAATLPSDGGGNQRKRSDNTALANNWRSSRMSVTEANAEKASANNVGVISGCGGGTVVAGGDLSNFFPSFDYFSNVDPRTMRRIVNSIALTGRLLRCFEVDFVWSTLYSWVSLVEQWPFRMCWLIECADECTDTEADDAVPLPELYNRVVKYEIATLSNVTASNAQGGHYHQHPFFGGCATMHRGSATTNLEVSAAAATALMNAALELDRNVAEFEATLDKMRTRRGSSRPPPDASATAVASLEQLTVAHAKVFSACTSNLDPSLRKLIREQRNAALFPKRNNLIDLGDEMNEDDETEWTEDGRIFNDGGDVGEDFYNYGNRQYYNDQKPMRINGPARYLFATASTSGGRDPVDRLATWRDVRRPLAQMSIDEVVELVEKLAIERNRLEVIVRRFYENNLNGLVLDACPLDELKTILGASLGDWTLIRLLIETLRKWKPSNRQRKSAAVLHHTHEESEKNDQSMAKRHPSMGTLGGTSGMMDSIREDGRDNQKLSEGVAESGADDDGATSPLVGGRDDINEGESNEDDEACSVRSCIGSRENLVQ